MTTQDSTVICGVPCLDNACIFQLEATPTDVSLLEVLFDGSLLPSSSDGGTNWEYSAPSPSAPIPSVTFLGAFCTILSNSTPAHPVHLEFRIVQVE
ncbi:MAG TPA: hypothetical protein VNY77_05815 [Candidatus Angelobacter sp.]|nr:hypothetical protein [Candidatus Angelobacter sp.]